MRSHDTRLLVAEVASRLGSPSALSRKTHLAPDAFL